jgi:uncharacterized membrane protein YjfL (UPF0719 family)
VEIGRFLLSLLLTVVWSVVAVAIVVVVFEVFQRRYRLLEEIFQENSVAAAILAGSFVIGVFYVVTQIVIH